MFQDYQESGSTLLGNKKHLLRGMFRLAPSNTTVANTLRRQILVGAPTVGFRTEPHEVSDVVIKHNTTPLVNEMLAHRIGMIPICADPHTFDPARYEFVLDKENTGREIQDIHAADFVVIERDPEDPMDAGRVVPTATFFPPDPLTGDTCLITRLRPQWNPIAAHERLTLKARASVSTGAENIRWSPVSQCSFQNTLDENAERQTAMFTEWVTTSKKIQNLTTLSEERQAELRREYNTMEIQRCFRVGENGEPNDFTFFVESVGVRSVPECVEDALHSAVALVKAYQDMDAEVPANVDIHHGDTRFVCVDFVFKNEDHTLGNLLQHYLVERHIEGTEEPRLSYAGYKVPHPLKKEMVVRVGLPASQDDPDTELQTARLVIAKVCRYLKQFFEEMLVDWSQAANGSQAPTTPQTPPTNVAE